jgi:hypothetical protein
VVDDVLSFIIVSWTPEVCICISLCKVDSPHNYGGVVQKFVARLGAKLDSNDRRMGVNFEWLGQGWKRNRIVMLLVLSS